MLKKLCLFFCIIAPFNSYAIDAALQEKIELCNKNSGDNCAVVGDAYYNGNGIKQDFNQAKEYNEKACELNNGYGCFLLGFQHFIGKGVKQDHKLGIYYSEKACELKEGGGGAYSLAIFIPKDKV